MCNIPKDMKWSFSRLQAYDQCPLAFKLQYIDNLPQEQNAYAEYGTFCHSLLERWAKGELMSFELTDAYTEGYDAAVREYFPPFPRGLAGKYYDEGLAYFQSFDGFGEEHEILSVEDKFCIDLRGHSFDGIADLILRDRNSGEITVIDHKSKSLPSMKKKLFESTRQLYIYAAYVKERFGVFPALLRFNMFRYGLNIDEPFRMERYEETLDWIERTISRIEADKDWLVSSSGYFCRWICSCRAHCPIGEEIIHAHERSCPE